jgi:hypothetical protein
MLNDLIGRLVGARVIRTKKLARLVKELADAKYVADQAEVRIEQERHRAEQLEWQIKLWNCKFRILSNTSVAIGRVSSLGRLLRPQQAHGFRKVRLGGAHDGGYICLDDFNDIAGAVSFGVGEDASWDKDVADRGIIVYQYDHTVAAAPILHANFRFKQRKIEAKANSECDSIESVLADNGLTRLASVILKIDIEHAEWDTFAATPNDVLDKFSQVICEFHGFDRITEDQWFERARNVLGKLNDKFAVVHVHSNNSAPLLVIGNFLFPQVLEVTYANKIKYTFNEFDETFPGILDAPNWPLAPDHNLGRFIY